MGMDVYGKAPRSEQGKYFRNNVWWWRPLADYCCEVAPEITSACQYWQSNDGDGLDDDDALALANALQDEVNSNRAHAYELRRQSEIEMMPNEPCWLCEGTGTRKPAPHWGAGDVKLGGIKCNGCQGSGYVRPPEDNDRSSVENIIAFIAFLRDCGGFQIW
jgi:hypothetical protein